VSHADLIGIPFVFGGRTLAGLDCWGLCLEFYKQRGIEVVDPLEEYHDLFATPASNVFEKYRTPDWYLVADPSDGDLVCMAYNNAGVATHCGIYLHGGRLLHTLDKIGVAISSYARYQKFVTAIYRHKGVPCQN
jgi:cell wall-associated NlpC family hydrolase